MLVFPQSPYTYVWADNNGTHKQGKVFPGQALVVKEKKRNGYWIEKPVLDRPIDPGYPKFWVYKVDVDHTPAVVEPPPPPPVVNPTIPEVEVANAIITIIRWLKG